MSMTDCLVVYALIAGIILLSALPEVLREAPTVVRGWRTAPSSQDSFRWWIGLILVASLAWPAFIGYVAWVALSEFVQFRRKATR